MCINKSSCIYINIFSFITHYYLLFESLQNILPKCTVSGLQAVQNSAARIVTQERL